MEINVPELNPEMVRKISLLIFLGFCLELTISYDAQDVYRIGTLMELVRVLALSFADDGKHVKVFSLAVCVIASSKSSFYNKTQ